MTGCCLKLKELMPSFSPKEQNIARYIIDFPNEVVQLSIKELAEICRTSVSSVVRLCKSAGYSGYKELCRTLSADMALIQQETVVYSDVRPGDTVSSIINSVCSCNMKSIENTKTVLSVEDVEKAVSCLCQASRIDFYAVGATGIVAIDAHNKFVRIHKSSMSSTDPHEQVLYAKSLKKGDAAVFFSYSGDTRDLLETADIVQKTGATMLSITRYNKNPLAQKADIALYCSSPDALIRSGVMSQRIGLLTVVDILYTAVVSQTYDQVHYALDQTRLVSAHKHINMQGTDFSSL